jgi:hypothetical protein
MSATLIRDFWPGGLTPRRHRAYLLQARASVYKRVRLMADNRYYGVRVEGAKYGVGFGSALAIAISYTNNHSMVWAIIDGILGWLYVIFFALFRS